MDKAIDMRDSRMRRIWTAASSRSWGGGYYY
jgi:hypothetical protein